MCHPFHLTLLPPPNSRHAAEWRYFFPSLWQSHNKGQEEGDFGGAIEDI